MKLKPGQLYEVRPGEWFRHDDLQGEIDYFGIPPSGNVLRAGGIFLVLSGTFKKKGLNPPTFDEFYFIFVDGNIRRMQSFKDIEYVVGIHVP